MTVTPYAIGQTCNGLPADSPVLSTSPDDIPPAAGGYVIAHDGHYFLGIANHVMGFVQTGPNEQKVWFTLNHDKQFVNCYYNRRYRADSSSPWYWEFSQSPNVLSFPIQPGDQWASLVIDTVLYSPTPKYGWNQNYQYVMYSTYQPHSCDLTVMGFAYVCYSTDGVCWTTPQPMRHTGGPSATCAPALGSDLVQVETLDAIDGGDTIYLMGIDGNTATLAQPGNMSGTGTTWGHASRFSPDTLVVEQSHIVSPYGMLNPLALQSTCDPDKYRPYAYFMNLAIAYDDVNGDLYVSRAYPWPYNRHGAVGDPCRSGQTTPGTDQMTGASLWNMYLGQYQQVQGVDGPPGTFPNRVQIYKLHIGSLANFGMVTSAIWTLVADYGNAVGYELGSFNQPLVDAQQTNMGHDYDAASFLRNGAGFLQLYDDGAPHIFGSTGNRTNLSVGVPYTTGNERTYFLTFPH
jgi:hypothetical protein